MALETGDIIDGKYRITGLIGEGGMGAVYAGENVRIQRRVAIKVLHTAFTANTEVVQRFEREAQAAGRIGNDHIMEVLDLGTLPNGDLFLVMEFLDGEPLSARLERGRLQPEQAVPLLEQVLVGLRAAHNAGIVHRDLKPENIFILKQKAGRAEFVKIIDFGISKFQPLEGDGMKMTRTGTMMGTPYYMSPEQATGSADVDARSDLYAVGVILYEMITGAVPFQAPSFNQLLFKIALEEPPPVEQLVPGIDPAFCSIISKAMAREPTARFQSADEFAQALRDYTSHGGGVKVVATPQQSAPIGATLDMKERPAELDRALQTPVAARDWSAAAQRTGAPGAALPIAGVTAGTFAATSPGAEPGRRSSKRIVAVLALGIVLVAGVAGVALSARAPAPDATTEAQVLPAAAPDTAAAPARETQVAPLAPAPPEPAAAEMPAASAEPQSNAALPENEPAPAPAPTKRAVTTRAAPKKPPAPAPSKPKGPAIPENPDFGY
jgi:serine/threonine-protein kinase